jgi:hypothetical protein
MGISDSISRIVTLLDSLERLDLGYPLGENLVVPPMPLSVIETSLQNAKLEGRHDLREFHAKCNGVRLPDVHNGYFLHSLDSLARHGRRDDIHEVLGPVSGSVVVIGSSGGGDLFTLRRRKWDVLCLPPGPVHAGRYDGTRAAVRRVAGDFGSFLGRLVADVEAFICDTPSHSFLA